jgi:hypothetical protein
MKSFFLPHALPSSRRMPGSTSFYCQNSSSGDKTWIPACAGMTAVLPVFKPEKQTLHSREVYNKNKHCSSLEPVENEQNDFIFSLISSWIPSLTLPFFPHPPLPLWGRIKVGARGGDTVEAGSTRFPPLKKGRVRVGIQNQGGDQNQETQENQHNFLKRCGQYLRRRVWARLWKPRPWPDAARGLKW